MGVQALGLRSSPKHCRLLIEKHKHMDTRNLWRCWCLMVVPRTHEREPRLLVFLLACYRVLLCFTNGIACSAKLWLFAVLLLKMMPVLLRRLSELNSIVERPMLACKLTELLQAVLEWDQLKVLSTVVLCSRGPSLFCCDESDLRYICS